MKLKRAKDGASFLLDFSSESFDEIGTFLPSFFEERLPEKERKALYTPDT